MRSFWTLKVTKTRLLRRMTVILLCMALLAGCASKSSTRRGGVAGTKPYTVLGKTYYPLKSAHGFVEEGIASWYGPGFHGKTTANGETYNQYAMTAAHKILPLGTNVNVTNLANGRTIKVRVNDRGPFVDDRVIDLSRAAATRLGMMGAGTTRVRVQAIGTLAQVTSTGDIKGNFYVQVGAFGQKGNAKKLIDVLTRLGQRGRLVFGSNNMWNVQIGPWQDSATAARVLQVIKNSYPRAFVVGDK